MADIADRINSDLAITRTKRLEENYKLVFKRGLKFMLNNFKGNNLARLNRLNRRDLELLFRKHYFTEIQWDTAIRQNPSFCLFNSKTINSEYLAFISSSEEFLNDFANFIVGYFEDDYSQVSDHKLTSFFEKCYSSIHLEGQSPEESIANVIEYVEKNTKCKLPWSKTELVKAKKSVLKLLRTKCGLKFTRKQEDTI